MAPCQGKHKSRALGIVHFSNPHGPGEDTGWVLSLNSAGAGGKLLASPGAQELCSSPRAESAEQSMER